MKGFLTIIMCTLLGTIISVIVITILSFTYKYYESHITIAKEIREIRLILEKNKNK